MGPKHTLTRGLRLSAGEINGLNRYSELMGGEGYIASFGQDRTSGHLFPYEKQSQIQGHRTSVYRSWMRSRQAKWLFWETSR